MPADILYNAGMQYTIRNVQAALDAAIRSRMKATGQSLNDTLLDAIADGLRAKGTVVKYRDLSKLAGTWVEDPGFDEAMKYFERIDPEMWDATHDSGAGHKSIHRLPKRRVTRRRSA
jgi:hypothetical protein